jgi:hypothetical protein
MTLEAGRVAFLYSQLSVASPGSLNQLMAIGAFRALARREPELITRLNARRLNQEILRQWLAMGGVRKVYAEIAPAL